MTTTADPTWEYKVATVGSWRGLQDGELEATLNELGQAGWEVLTAFPVYGTSKVTVVARRTPNRNRRRARVGADWQG